MIGPRRIAFSVASWLFLAPIGQSQAHDWYPADCCSGTDCVQVSDARFERLQSGGWRIDGKWDFPPVNAAMPKEGETRWSESGRFHTCEPVKGDRPRCVFVPPDGT